MINHIVYNKLLPHKEYNQYLRHIILSQVGTIGQQRLKQAKILIIGAGGLACPCIMYLVACGVGYIGVIDNDIVSISNLQRQILYGFQDVNRMKTKVVQKRIQEMNRTCVTQLYSYQLNNKNATDLIKRYDIIIDTSDNFKTRYIIDDTCYKLHKIHIYGAIQNFEGQISVFNYKSGPRYSDLYPQHLDLNNYNCNNHGVLGVIPGIIGTLQATEAIKVILGLDHILSGTMIIYNAYRMTFRTLDIKSMKKYLENLNHNIETINDNNWICKSDLKSINKTSLTFIDIRQKIEFEELHIENAINIPLKLIESNHKLNLIRQHAKTNTVIVYCNNNSRSTIASQILNKYKIQHSRLKNGLHEWTK